MKYLIGFLLSSLCFAEGTYEQLNRPDLGMLRQEGKLVSVGIVLGEPVKIFVIGKEEAKMDLTDLKLTVRRLQPYPAKTLAVSRSSDYFIISEPNAFEKTSRIEVTTKVKNKTETLRFKIESKPLK